MEKYDKTETFFSDTSTPTISGYTLYRRDRDFILNTREDERGVEQIWCSLCKGTDKVFVGYMYRPPGSEPRFLRELFKSIQRAKDRVD